MLSHLDSSIHSQYTPRVTIHERTSFLGIPVLQRELRPGVRFTSTFVAPFLDEVEGTTLCVGDVLVNQQYRVMTPHTIVLEEEIGPRPTIEFSLDLDESTDEEPVRTRKTFTGSKIKDIQPVKRRIPGVTTIFIHTPSES